MVADRVGWRPPAGCIGRQPVRLAASQKLPDRLPERLAENVPQRDVDSADRRNGQSAPGERRHGVALSRRRLVPHAVIEHFPGAGDVAGVAPDQQRADLVIEEVNQRCIGARASGGILAFAPADKPVIGLDPHDRSVERGQPAEIAAVLP